MNLKNDDIKFLSIPFMKDCDALWWLLASMKDIETRV
jgi:hypothetical protein